jgi:glycosyltransferase involved in cell wall biosynthesis
MYRILHVLAQRPGRTGSGIFLNSLIVQAAAEHHQQAVIAGIPIWDKLDFPQIAEQNKFPVHFETADLSFPVAGMSDTMPYPSTRYSEMDPSMLRNWTKAFEEKIHLAMDKFKPDIVLTHHLWLLTGIVRNLLPDIPVIAISHGTGLRQLQLASNLKEQVIKSCYNVDLVLALNDFQKLEIHKKYKIDQKKILVIGSGYNSDIFYPNPRHRRSDKVKLVYCGKLSKAKGTIQLIRVFNSLLRSFDDLELVMIGSGNGEEEKQVQYLAQKNIDHIEFKGSVPQNEVGDIFRQCDIFVLPSFYEGLPLVVLEALASGLLVASTEIPGLRNWLGDKINASSQIEYVKLPRLKNMDQPVEEDIPVFENDLKSALIKMINSHKADKIVSCSKEISQKSWRKLFNTIEIYIDNLIN